MAMEVRETGLQAKPGFAGHTWPAGHTGFCWPYRVLLAKQGFAGQTGLQAKPGLAGQTGFAGQTGLQAKPGLAGHTGFAGQTGLQAKPGLAGHTGFAGTKNQFAATNSGLSRR